MAKKNDKFTNKMFNMFLTNINRYISLLRNYSLSNRGLEGIHNTGQRYLWDIWDVTESKVLND